MGSMNNKRPRKLLYVVNQRRHIRGDKVKKAVKHYHKLQQRQKIEGNTKWIVNAFRFVEAKLKRYGIHANKI